MLHALRDAQLGQARLNAHSTVPGWSATLVRRLRLSNTLQGHDGCVNTVQFSPCGQILVSGSDDMQVFFWDWQLGTKTLGFASGHTNNVFQARIMPHTHNATVVTCAADGQVRVAAVPQGSGGGSVETRRLAGHRGRAHKLSLDPCSPTCFFSCGEDGEVRHFDLREPAAACRRLLACRSTRGRLELNSVHARPHTSQFCVGGGDAFVRLYDLRRVPPSDTPTAQPVRRLAPYHLRNRRGLVTITCAVFSQSGSEVLATYNDENVYLFAADEAAAPHADGYTQQQQQQQQQKGRRRTSTGGVSGSSRDRKRARRGGGSAHAGRASQQDAGAGTLGQQRRAAAAAALAQAERQRAASGAAAAAAAHAGIRRGLEAEDVGSDEGFIGPAPPSDAAGPSSRQADAAWLQRLPPREHWEDEAAPVGELRRQQEQQAAAMEPQGPDVSSEGAAVMTTSGGAGCSGEEEGQQDSGSQAAASSSSSEDDEGEWDGEGRPPAWLRGAVGTEASQGSVEEEEEEEEEDSEEEETDEADEFEDEGELPQGALVDSADAAPGGGGLGEPGGGGEGAPGGDSVLQVYKGHRNYRTVKGVSFLGAADEFVTSGSDCGHVYIWDKATGAAQALLKGDHDTVNCLEPHPHHLLTMATSGIEDTIKLWTPSAEEQQVVGAAQERVMAANQRGQGEERRMFVSPQMLQVLLRMRQLEAMVGDSEEEGEEAGSSGDEEQDGVGGGQRRRGPPGGDCSIM